MKKKERAHAHVFSAPLSATDLAMLKKLSAAEDIPMANLFRRWVRQAFEARFPGERG